MGEGFGFPLGYYKGVDICQVSILKNYCKKILFHQKKQLAIIIVLLLIIPLGAKFIIQKITKSKSAGIVAFIIALGLIAFVYFFETVQ